MTENCSKIFSLAEANLVVRELTDLTAEVIRRLDGIRGRYNITPAAPGATLPQPVLQEVESVLEEWMRQVSELGCNAKGYFTVDFQSADPEMLYCWTYGEDNIAFAHKVWENFSHRRPLTLSVEPAADHLKWVN
jgi:hypothetical protein